MTFSFLISSPMVDLGSLVLLMSVFGARAAALYVILGLVIAVTGGTILEKLHIEREVEPFILSVSSAELDVPEPSRRERITYAKEQMLGTFRKVFHYILVGVGLGAVIHNWIPTVVGVPMYADIFGTIPVAEALFGKGRFLERCCPV